MKSIARVLEYITSPFLIKKGESSIRAYGDCIVRNLYGKVLLLQRTNIDSFGAGEWCLPGGKIENGELFKQGAERELEEETGLLVGLEYVGVVEHKDRSVTHYYEGVVTAGFSNQLLIDSSEHMRYDWADIEDIINNKYKLIADLGEILPSLLKKLKPIVALMPQKKEIEDLFGTDRGYSMFSEIKDTFDNSLISGEQFVGFIKDYNEIKKTILKDAFDKGEMSVENFVNFLKIEKSKRALPIGTERNYGDERYIKTTDGWRLKTEEKYSKKKEDIKINKESEDRVLNTTTSKELKKRSSDVEKRISSEEEQIKEQKKKEFQERNSWWQKYREYNLSAYPVNVNQDDVKVDMSGDIDSHAIMTWKDSKTGIIKRAYTQGFLHRNAQVKWQRVEKFTSKMMESIRRLSLEKVVSEKDSKDKDAAAILAIISHTGLRRGDKAKFKVTGNRGVSTLSPDDVQIVGDKISLSFIGKSYKHNVAEVEDANLASYISKLKEVRKEEDFLFNTTDDRIDAIFDEIGGEGYKVKDMRTYVATEEATNILFKDKTPIDRKLPINKQKKIIQDRLKNCFEQVSQRLNNTPAMARTAYVHPKVIEAWLNTLDISFDIKKGESSFLLDLLSKKATSLTEIIDINEEDEEMCDEYNLPDWWEEDSSIEGESK